MKAPVSIGLALMAAMLSTLAAAEQSATTYSPKVLRALTHSAAPVFLATRFPRELGNVALEPIVAISDKTGYAVLWQRDPKCEAPRCEYASMTGIIDEPLAARNYETLHFSDGEAVSYQPFRCPAMTCQPEVLEWKLGRVTYHFTTREQIGFAGVKIVYRSLKKM